MTSIVLLVLVAAWAGYLFLWWKDGREATSTVRRDSLRGMGRGLESLGSMTASARGGVRISDLSPRGTDLTKAPATPAAAARRRREVIVVLAAIALVTLLATAVLGPIALLAHVLVDALLVGYVYAVVRRQHLMAEREIKVRMLYPDRVAAAPAAAGETVIDLRHSAVGS